MKIQITILLATLLITGSMVQATVHSPKIFNLIFLTSHLAPFFQIEQKPIADLVAWLKKRPDEVNAMTLCQVKVARAHITPLIHAIICSNFDAITLLLNHPNININLQDSRGKTALHHLISMIAAMSIDHSDEINEKLLKILAALIAKGASIKIQDDLGHTPLDSIPPQLYDQVQRCIKQNDKLLLEGARRADWRAIQLAMRDGADINAQDVRPGLRGYTAVRYAIIHAVNQIVHDNVEPQSALNLLRLILSYQPDLNIENEDGQGMPGVNGAQLAATWPDVLKVLLETPQERMSHLLNDHRYRQ